jgi:hypothetical protein
MSAERDYMGREYLWTPEYEVHHDQLHGQEWPIVIVEKFETNWRGERRYVETKRYQPVEKVPTP